MKNPLLDAPASADARGKRIRYVRDHLLSQTRNEFCQNAEITLPALKGWELGWGGGLTQQGAEKIAKRAKELGVYCSESWLLYGIGREAIYITKDLDLNEIDENHIAKELLLFRELQHSIDALVKDDGMMPLLNPGNYVGGIIVDDIEEAIGKECIIIDDANTTFVRILQQGEKQDVYNLCCLNQRPLQVKKEIKNISIKIAAPIIWIRRLHRSSNK